MDERMSLALEVQAFAEKQLCPMEASAYTDVEQWNQMQRQLVRALADLERMEGTTPQEEGEVVLALLMGYGVAVRNGARIARVLKRAAQVMPCLTDKVLKCKLAAHCYVEYPDAVLLDTARILIAELKREGRGKEILRVEEMIA